LADFFPAFHTNHPSRGQFFSVRPFTNKLGGHPLEVKRLACPPSGMAGLPLPPIPGMVEISRIPVNIDLWMAAPLL